MSTKDKIFKKYGYKSKIMSTNIVKKYKII